MGLGPNSGHGIAHGIRDISGLAKQISKWRGHGTLKSMVGHHSWPQRKSFKF